MKKLRFNLNDLQVQSFETTADRRAMPRGTVLGQTELPIEPTAWNDPACNPNYTQGSSCQNGGESCDGCGLTSYTCGGDECIQQTSACEWTNQGHPCGTAHCGSTTFECTEGDSCFANTCNLSCVGYTCPPGSC